MVDNSEQQWLVILEMLMVTTVACDTGNVDGDNSNNSGL